MTTDAATVARLAHISDEEMSEDIDDLIALLERYAGPAREDLKLRAAAALREQRDKIAAIRNLPKYELVERWRLEKAEAERDAAMLVIEAAKAMRNWPTLVDLIPRMAAFDAALAKLEGKC